MSFSLKRLPRANLEAAIAKAAHYRDLNQPEEAEGICRDVLDVDPGNQAAWKILGLAITDQFGHESGALVGRARETLERLTDPYQKAYYAGIIRERRAKAVLHHQRYGAVITAIDWLKEAMDCFERAERIRPAHNDDAVLRWNTCARLLMTLPEIEPESSTPEPIQLE